MSTSGSLSELKQLVPNLVQEIPFLKLLILFGSRATGQNHEDSDYDFALICDQQIYQDWKKKGKSWFSLYSIFENVFDLPNETVDIVDLDRCSPILAHEIACDGKLLYEKRSGEYDEFLKRSLMSHEQTGKMRQEQRQNLERKLQVLGV
ncbi:nucleotidyltransferase domain-containing protein [Pseudanabaena sp. FACHB-1277]|jgi:predicted nucleotidyltransferase|uniref:Nucleotidyltransferase domain-containing protein n=1 Tax=Pseudanabaena cinerea FACHB-1277 TaxID=2949581 RepID=A0A926URZ1_9CYAN|nr:nucleotidyltransferase domain-containing protein [Pseudanabaena cinerea]MBD2150014.1 nucleotidyltransferase domain-containing protein [Pseudanabaena cinerea FACHB-1277]